MRARSPALKAERTQEIQRRHHDDRDHTDYQKIVRDRRIFFWEGNVALIGSVGRSSGSIADCCRRGELISACSLLGRSALEHERGEEDKDRAKMKDGFHPVARHTQNSTRTEV